MALWIGVDDTDSLRGMCTTFLATEFVRELRGYADLIGYPRLVRLNPNIPWKTRGNGALCMAVGEGRGPPFRVGRFGGEDVYAYPRGRAIMNAPELVDGLSALVERWSDLDSEGTDPGLVVLQRKPKPGLYWRAVRGIVSKAEALREIRGLGSSREWKSGRGLIGAASACAWRPRDRTWEILAYRDRAAWGSPRNVDPASVRRMDRRFPSTFNNYDYENRRVTLAPRTPCPVLCGIRGDDPLELPRALGTLRGEKPERWLIFLTNQGTDDHVQTNAIAIPRTGGRFAGTVTRTPATLRGGHVVFGLGDHDVTVYEPAKQFRDVARALLPGDCITVVGSVRDRPRTVNAEKIRVDRLVAQLRKVSNPACPACGHRTKSMGRGSPFRCPTCGKRLPREAAEMTLVPRRIEPGWYEPPTGSRRHLSKPLKRVLTL